MQLAKKTYGYPDILLLPLRSAPLATSALLFIQLISGAMPTLEILFIADFLDAATRVVTNGAAASTVYTPIALMALAVAWNWLSWPLLTLATARVRVKSRQTLRVALTEQRARLRYRYIEDASAWDLIQRVCKEPENQMTDALGALLQMSGLIMRVAGVMALLFTHVWWAALIVIGVSAPLMALAVKGGKASYQAERDNTKIKRRYEYLSDVLMGRACAPERALFGYGEALNEEYEREFLTAYRHTFRVRGRWMFRSKVGGTLYAAIALAVTLVLLPAAIAGTITFGLFVSLANAITGMVNMVAWSLGHQVDALAKRREGLRDLTEFMHLAQTPGALDLPGAPIDFNRLEFRDVRFTYPGTDAQILKGLSLTIQKGGHYAFVGANGAGKTTITRILSGLYDEYEGEILLNGRDLRSYTPAQLKGCFSIVYQDFAKYSISVEDNVAFQMPDRARRAAQVLDATGLTEAVALLPEGIETPLGKVDAQGQDLSGGQWQRLAMARAAANPAPVRILDEPTAALDPIGESQVYRQFERISQGKTTIFISHRLGSTSLADSIFVLDGGRVLEQGTHEQLMEKGGLYAQMYASQRSWYE